MRLLLLVFAFLVLAASAATLASAVANAKIYEDPHKSLAQLSDEFKAIAVAPLGGSKSDLNHRARGDASVSVCLNPPCETEDMMVSAQRCIVLYALNDSNLV